MFFINDTATTEIYTYGHTLSLHDALPICAGNLDAVLPGLQAIVDDELRHLGAHWPSDLPAHVIHADLFPDNVLMLGDRVTGLIDFYFAASDFRAYDLVITHSSWAFSADGSECDPARARALMRGYASEISLTAAEIAALPMQIGRATV